MSCSTEETDAEMLSQSNNQETKREKEIQQDNKNVYMRRRFIDGSQYITYALSSSVLASTRWWRKTQARQSYMSNIISDES